MALPLVALRLLALMLVAPIPLALAEHTPRETHPAASPSAKGSQMRSVSALLILDRSATSRASKPPSTSTTSLHSAVGSHAEPAAASEDLTAGP
nr:hypothetical protein [Streptomyces dioscori]